MTESKEKETLENAQDTGEQQETNGRANWANYLKAVRFNKSSSVEVTTWRTGRPPKAFRIAIQSFGV